MKKKLLLIILPTCLGSLTLIALSYGKERIVNPVSVANLSTKIHQTANFKNSIAEEEKLDSEISDIARKAIELGHYNYARQQIEIIEHLPLKVELLRELIDAYLAVGQTRQASLIINQAVELDKQSDSFDSTTWATDWLLTGQENKVKDIITNIDGTEEQQAQVYLTLAQSYLKAGKIAKAFELSGLIPSDILLVPDDYPDPRNELLQEILQQALQEEKFELASQVAISFPRKIEQVGALKTIATHYFKQKKETLGKGKLAQALEITKTIDSVPVFVDRHTFWDEPNANLLLDIAEDYQKLGEQQKAVEILELAIESIKNFKTQFTFDVVVWNRSQALRQVASRYLNFGETEKAIAILDLATKEAKRFKRKREVLIEELLAIAKVYIKLDKKQQADLLWQEAFNKLKIIDPKSAELVLETAKIAVLVGRQEEGLKLVDQTQAFLMQLEITALADQEKLTKQLAEPKLKQINQLPFDEKYITLEQIAFSLSENSSLAFNLSETIKNPLDKADFLIAFSKKSAQKNNWNLVNTILDKAVAAANTIPDQKQREQWFIDTINRLIQVNQLDERLFEEEQLTLPLWQLRLAEKITQKSNLTKLKLTVFFKITEKDLSDINEETALNRFNQSFDIWKNYSYKQEFIQDFRALFKLSLKLNQRNFALVLAKNIPHTDYKIVFLRQVAQKYAMKGNKEKAKIILSEVEKITQTIADKNRQVEISKGITEQLYTIEQNSKVSIQPNIDKN